MIWPKGLQFSGLVPFDVLDRSPPGGRVAEMLVRNPLLIIASAVVAGVSLDGLLPSLAWWTAGGASVAAVLAVGLAKWRNAARLAAVLLLFSSLAGLRHRELVATYQANELPTLVGEGPTVLHGVVDEAVGQSPVVDPSGRRPMRMRVVVEVRSVQRRLTDRPIDGRALVMLDATGGVDGPATWRPGDPVRLLGTLRRFEPPSNPGETDRRGFALREGLHVQMDADSGQRADVKIGWPAAAVRPIGVRSFWRAALRPIATLSAAGRMAIDRHVGLGQSDLAAALVLGSRDSLTPAARERLLVTGTAHLLSVSGLHLGIVVGLVSVIAAVLGFSLGVRWWLVVIAALAYVALTGGRPPVIRAAVLIISVGVGVLAARQARPLNTLSLAAIGLLLWNPLLIGSVGLQLSFLAVATLLMCGESIFRPPGPGGVDTSAAGRAMELENRLAEMSLGSRPAWQRRVVWIARQVSQLVWFSAAVTALTLPIVWSQFHLVSPIAVVVNVLLTPLMTVALSLGVLTLVAAPILPAAADGLGLLCGAGLWSMRAIIDFAGELPGAYAWLPSPPAAMVLAFYAVIAATLLWRPRGRRRWWITGWICLWIPAAHFAATRPQRLPRGTLEATFVDVGHGTSVVLRGAQADRPGDVWVYDAGWLGNAAATSRPIEETLWSMGITRIDKLFVSHADSDHLNAVPSLLERFGVGEILTPPGMWRGTSATVRRVLGAIERRGISRAEVAAGQTVGGAGVLHPPAVPLEASDNANSMVLMLDRGGRTLALPGDLEPPGTAVLTRQPRPKPGGIWMAPHHGSLRMDAPAVLAWGRPAAVVVSGGDRANRPEVDAMLSERGAAVHVTARGGAVRLRIADRGEVEVRQWLAQPW